MTGGTNPEDSSEARHAGPRGQFYILGRQLDDDPAPGVLQRHPRWLRRRMRHRLWRIRSFMHHNRERNPYLLFDDSLLHALRLC